MGMFPSNGMRLSEGLEVRWNVATPLLPSLPWIADLNHRLQKKI